MGNRAVISIGKEYSDTNVGIYVHWNGGKDSVEGFLLAAKRQLGGRLGDGTYGTARLIQCVTSFFPGALSAGVGVCGSLDCDNGDNGVYVVDPETMEIVDRKHFDAGEQQEHNPKEIAELIVRAISTGEAATKTIVNAG